jgi:hypothetical protein
MNFLILFGIFFLFCGDDGEPFRSYILKDSNGGIIAGFSLNRTDSKWGTAHETEPVATGGYEGNVWKSFRFGRYLSAGALINFSERKVHTSGLYYDTSIPELVIYKSIEHKEESEGIGIELPVNLKIFKIFTLNPSIEFLWRKASLQHGEGESSYSIEIIQLNLSELHLRGRIGGEFRTNFFNFSFFFGIPLFLKGDAELLKYLAKDKGATFIIEPGIQWDYDPKPPPLIRSFFDFHYGNFALFLTHSFTKKWGGSFLGVDKTEYKLEGIESYDIGITTSYRFAHHEFLLGFNYEGRDYETKNLPILNGERFLIFTGYKSRNHPPFGVFLRSLLSDMDYRSIRNMSVFLTQITFNFFIGF